jgi:hypothetical protein
MLWKLSQRTFNGGQLDRRLMGRADLAKYYAGASVLKNFVVKRQGCIVKRRGTVQIADVSTILNAQEITDYRLLPFTYENEYGYILLLAASEYGNKCYVFAKDGTLKDTIDNIPYSGSDFGQISTEQSGDMLFMAHQSFPFARIARHGDTDWRYEIVDFENCGHDTLPETPTITNAEMLPAGSWTGSGPQKSIYYIVTAVKDGVESRPSDPYKVTYNTPWPEGGSVKLTVATQNPAPDYYNIYKKQDSYTGLIGTTSTGTANTGTAAVTTLPSQTGAYTEYRGHGIPRNIDGDPGFVGRPEKTGEVDDATSYGYVVPNGIYTVTYATAQDVDIVSLSIGYVWYGSAIGTVQNARYYIQFLPCACSTVKAVVTFDDNTTQDLGLLSVPDAAKSTFYDNSVTGDPYASSTGAAIDAKRKEMAQHCKLTWNINNRDSKKVKSVAFTAYSDSGTTVATGTISNMTSSGGWATINGNPFTISGYWAVKYTQSAVNELVDEYIAPDASLTPPTYAPHFGDTGKYPGCVAMYQQRLALARTIDQPFTFWLSCIGDLYNFNAHESIREDDAMEVTLPATKYPDINHMILNRDLIMFCDSGEWIVAPVTGNSLTYKTISTKIQSQMGSSKRIKPIVVGDDVIFANMTDETLIATKYSYATDGYESTDLSVLSQDIFRGNAITSLAYKQHPDSILVATLADGTFATLEYMKEHEVVAWSHHELGGGLKARYCCADGSVTDGTTDVYILAEDTSDPTTQKFYLLRIKEDAPLDTVRHCISMDQMSEVGGTGTIPEGFTAVNVRTGETETTRRTGHTYIIGRPFTATLVTVKPEPNAHETVRFEIKNPTEAEICVNEGSTFKIGQFGMDASKDRTASLEPTVTPFDNNYYEGWVELVTKDVSIPVTGANRRDGRIRLTCDGYWPLTVLSLSVTYQIEMANQEPKGLKGGGDED